MRPGQGQRRGGRRNENRHGHGGGNGGQHRSNQGGQNQGQNRSAQSLRNQIFDSNGPDMRVRGNAFQVHEKYQALAKDALSSGDRVLAENYLQHAEHYFRIIEAINEATAAEQRTRQASWESQPQPNSMAQQYADGQPQTGDQQPQDGQPQDQNGNYVGGQDGQYQQQGQNNGQQHQDGQQNFRRDRNRDNRDNRREGNRDNYGNRNQQRFGNPDNRGNQQGYDQNQNPNQNNAAQHSQVEYAPHNQQQPPQGQSQDPLYDGVDEDVDSPDTQAAVGGRR